MSDTEPRPGEPLQFDSVSTPAAAGADARPSVACTGCGARMADEYYEVNGRAFCARCRRQIDAFAAAPAGLAPFLTAAAFGIAAGVAGAVVYYLFIAITNLEIGIVAILIGYMVGYAVRRGAGGRGGRRFQVLAVTLTYLSVALAYAPLVLKSAVERPAREAAASASRAGAGGVDPAEVSEPGTGPGTIFSAVVLAGFLVALPLVTIASSFPSGLISGLIIFFGMAEAWRRTAAPRLQIRGPYRVGAPTSSTPA
ncbi:MAG TPA: hypothetical protein VL309_09735 [Vicinamibacterales bacterium]|jgi:hypothetical protein|nr:hypothetical protein [Vicinamibacterales bacterium]